ncbi:MAG: radical SAM family heme chaperone HemW [Pseudomonadales bacterium]|nr:radical SAM family heme chaperone HemW [Pseudomonadales bacterium]
MLPLSLYIHIPWCIKKCPYCDFNSHTLDQKNPGDIPESEYVAALLEDLEQDLERYSGAIQNRPLHSIFFGGGTPSLLSSGAAADLLHGINKLITVPAGTEITLEANPGTFETEKFKGFFQAGINRLSIGVQSFNNEHLQKLGRIHDGKQAIYAIEGAHEAGFTQFNIDLMHGLPGQTHQQALADLTTAIELSPTHLSWYQLTIEKNTQFYSYPPLLPAEEQLWRIQETGFEFLKDNGFEQYEISAFSKAASQCKHNLNYWRFGDYLGIGAGAHGKITTTNLETGTVEIQRSHKHKQPTAYLDASKAFLAGEHTVDNSELPIEFLMNVFRLRKGVDAPLFEQRTGLPLAQIAEPVERAIKHGLIEPNSAILRPTSRGSQYLDDLLQLFI